MSLHLACVAEEQPIQLFRNFREVLRLRGGNGPEFLLQQIAGPINHAAPIRGRAFASLSAAVGEILAGMFASLRGHLLTNLRHGSFDLAFLLVGIGLFACGFDICPRHRRIAAPPEEVRQGGVQFGGGERLACERAQAESDRIMKLIGRRFWQAKLRQFGGEPCAAILPAPQGSALPSEFASLAQVIRILRADEHADIEELGAFAHGPADGGGADIEAEHEAVEEIVGGGGELVWHGESVWT